MKKSLILLLVVISFSCSVFKVTPTYNPTAVEMVRSAAENTNQMYSDMINTSDKTYDLFESTYLSISKQINDILVFDSARDKSKVILMMANDIKKRFSKYEFEHKSSVTLNNSQVQSYRDGMSALWKSLYNAEINLKP